LPGELGGKGGMEGWIAADRIKGLDFGASSAVQPTPAPPVQVSSTPPVQNVAPPVRYTAPPVKAAARSAQPETRDIAGPLWFLDPDFNHLISTAIVRGIRALQLIPAALRARCIRGV